MRVRLYVRLILSDCSGKEEIIDLPELDEMDEDDRDDYIGRYWERWVMDNVDGDWKKFDI